MPAIKKVKAGETADLTGYVNGSEKVHAISNNGTMGRKYTKGAGTTTGGVTTGTADNYVLDNQGHFTPPTDANETQYIIEYNRTVTDGVAIYNKADKFPGTVKLVLKVLAIEPCTADCNTHSRFKQ